ncbi:MAG TPA: glycosyltransferase family 4 protein [Selenomonadales bacterium]|nr:glycosyltransferase family 4 protein [Selenomonadales bacterium]
MKIAIIHDWLVTYAGAERVLEQIIQVYPEADLFSLVDFLPSGQRHFIAKKSVKTSFIQGLPWAKTKYRQYLALMPLAVEQLDVSAYDLVISSSHAVAKGVLTGPDQRHISYVHTPIRYAWDMQHQYLREANLERGLKGALARGILHYIRNWDYRTANGVDSFVANSGFIARRIWKVYRREAAVIYPPVDIDTYSLFEAKEGYYLTASRIVPYKKIDLIVEAFREMPDKQLVVIGDGPDFTKIRSKAGKNISLLGYQSPERLKYYLQRAKAFVFAAEEDFGIAPVEAQACGTPVVAYGKGGVLETVRGLGRADQPTGLFFGEQSKEALIAAVQTFEQAGSAFSPQACRQNALRFSAENFRNLFQKHVNTVLNQSESHTY